MPTVIFKVDCGKPGTELKHELACLENKVQEALTELGYDYLVFSTEYRQEALLDIEDYAATVSTGSGRLPAA